MESRRGIGAAEVIVLVLIAVVVGLLLLSALPRRREVARLTACRRNLGEIGEALLRFEAARNRLPSVPELGPGEPSPMSGPLAELLVTLNVRSFNALGDSAPDAETKVSRPPTDAFWVQGFLCPADSQFAGASRFVAPVNYRATTGDTAEGTGGAFAPGRPPTRLSEIEAGDGLAYTTAFAERLRGSGTDVTSAANYALVPGPLGSESCPEPPADAWRGNAGSDWSQANWTSTLYNHAMIPNEAPSCIAEDRRTARMGASSGHVEGVNVLKFDMSVTTVTNRIDRKIWRNQATYSSAAVPGPHD